MDTSKKIEEKVSIILPCHNEAEWIEECIDSLINQTYQNIEIVIVDDGSKDNSFTISEKMQQKYGKDKIIIYRFDKNKGEGSARNMGVKLSTGEYILQSDMDAIFPKDFIQKSTHYISKEGVDSLSLGELRVHPKRRGVLADYWRAKRKATFLLRKSGKREEVMTIYFYSKKLWETLGGYEENVPLSTDFDFGMRARLAGFKNLWTEDTYFEHADPTKWKVFFMRLLNGAKYSVPIQKKWKRWLSDKQKIKELLQTSITLILIILGFLGFYKIIFFIFWLIILLVFGFIPIFIHKETKLITDICIKNKYWKTLFALPVINVLRITSSNLGKSISIIYYKKIKKTVTFDV